MTPSPNASARPSRAVPSRRRALRHVPAVVLLLCTGLLVTLAVLHEGVPHTRMDVNDGGIWVTHPGKKLVGHLNHQSRTLDGVLRTDSARFDVQQFEDSATLWDTSVNAVSPIDVAAVRLGASTSLAEGATMVQGGNRLAVLDPQEGNLWITPAASPATVQFTTASARATDMEAGAATAGPDGTVAAIGVEARRFVVISPRGETDEMRSIRIPDLPASADASITVVGDQPVALDSRHNTLILPNGKIFSLSERGVPSGGVLQLPSAAHSRVLLATPNSLVSVALDGSSVDQVQAAAASNKSGTPARPARLNGCEYSAWAESGTFLRRCEGLPDHRQDVPGLVSATDIRFRINRRIIVLNDTATGSVWLPDENMVMAVDWDKIDDQLDDDDEEESSEQTDEIADPERKEQNTPPIAVNDIFGVRPGGTTTLDVLANDSDPDGDVLTARALGSSKQLGAVTATRGGRALQVRAPATLKGAVSFEYEASDGLAVSTATVKVEVHPMSRNEGPRQLRDPHMKLGAKAEARMNILPHWRDPNGDPVYLESVTAPNGLQVRFREEGTITVRDLGRAPGPVPVVVKVSDGRVSTTGTLTVDLQGGGNLPPVANGDFYVARVGEDAQIAPLANDTDPNGDVLQLAGLSAAPKGTTVIQDPHVGSLTFRAKAKGTYYLSYTVSDGPDTAVGLIRIDVVPDTASAKPVAEDDLVLLPKGGAALAAPLNNDSDPAGGVLVLQSVDVGSGARLDVTIVDRHLLRITAPAGLERATELTYTVSNGTHTASAKVLVVPTRALDDSQPPQAQPDRTTVRVGDVGSVAVLANDRSPGGLGLNIDPAVERTGGADVGHAFVTGNLLRLEAGNKPGVMHVAYTVRDSAGNTSSSTATFEVVDNKGPNAAPRPKDLTAWAVSGQTARIPIPVVGIDPDGDSVTLLGIDQPPQLGTAVLGTDWLEYTPAEGHTGTDVFTYTVEDRQGKQASARIRVGIAPPSTTNQKPSAVSDTLLVRPNRVLSLAVLENDIDADGDPLSLVADGVQSDKLTVKVGESVLSVVSPSQPGAYAARYRISDGRGGVDDGTVTLNVRPDAPLMAPMARDDVLSLAEVPTDGTPAVVDILKNDEDPDGPPEDLTITVEDEGASVIGRKLSIIPHETRRLVVYTITDADGLSSSAVVSVPGTLRERPRLDDTKVPVSVRSGQKLTVDLHDYVLVREGRTPRLIDGIPVRGTVGAASAPRTVDNHTIEFIADEEFAGLTSVTFQVIDGTQEDRAALTATLTIPIQVLPAINHPPRLTPTPVTIAAGEEPTSVDMSLMVDDPDGKDPTAFTYEVLRAPKGVTVTPNAHKLMVSTALTATKGPAGTIRIGVDDGSGVVTTEIPVTIVASNRPLIIVSDAMITTANAGAPVRVDLKEYTINPFPETPVDLKKASVGLGSGEVDPQGTVLTITPAAGFHGQMTVTYLVGDATGDQDRFVEGRVRLVVRDKPDAPTQVEAQSSEASTATVSFQAPASNGAPITGYVVTDAASEATTECPRSPCVVEGLSNGTQHSFTVAARNDVGLSDPSAPSPAVLVEGKPQQPEAPVGEPGDRSVDVSWQTPPTSGSPVSRYLLFASHLDQPIIIPAPTTSYTFTGLTNGQSYTFRVQAMNERDSEVSTQSGPVIPFGRPGAPTVRQTLIPGNGDLARAQITWSYPSSSNGRPWDQVKVTYDGQEKVINSDGSVTSTEIDLEPRRDVRVEVSLHTEGGWSDPGTVTFTARSVPVAMSTVPTVEANGVDGELIVSRVLKQYGNGYWSVDLSVEYSTDDGKTWRPLGSQSRFTGLPNGTPVTFMFRQVSDAGGYPAAGPAVKADPATPYGPPIAPSLTAAATKTGGTFTWSATESNGGPKVTTLVLSVSGDDGTRESIDLMGKGFKGSVDVAGSTGERLQASVKACDSEGTCTTSDTARTRVWGTVTARPAGCLADEKLVPPLPKDAKPEDCHTFEALQVGWDSGTTLTCTFASDLDKKSHQFTLGAGWVRSGLRTNVTDAAAIEKWPAAGILVCRP